MVTFTESTHDSLRADHRLCLGGLILCGLGLLTTGNDLEVDVLSDGCGRSVWASRLALVLAELCPVLALGNGVTDFRGLQSTTDATRDLDFAIVLVQLPFYDRDDAIGAGRFRRLGQDVCGKERMKRQQLCALQYSAALPSSSWSAQELGLKATRRSAQPHKQHGRLALAAQPGPKI